MASEEKFKRKGKEREKGGKEAKKTKKKKKNNEQHMYNKKKTCLQIVIIIRESEIDVCTTGRMRSIEQCSKYSKNTSSL